MRYEAGFLETCAVRNRRLRNTKKKNVWEGNYWTIYTTNENYESNKLMLIIKEIYDRKKSNKPQCIHVSKSVKRTHFQELPCRSYADPLHYSFPTVTRTGIRKEDERNTHRKTTTRRANGKNAQLFSLPSSQTMRDVCEVSDHGAHSRRRSHFLRPEKRWRRRRRKSKRAVMQGDSAVSRGAKYGGRCLTVE